MQLHLFRTHFQDPYVGGMNISPSQKYVNFMALPNHHHHLWRPLQSTRFFATEMYSFFLSFYTEFLPRFRVFFRRLGKKIPKNVIFLPCFWHFLSLIMQKQGGKFHFLSLIIFFSLIISIIREEISIFYP